MAKRKRDSDDLVKETDRKTDQELVAQNLDRLEIPDHLRLHLAKRLLNEINETQRTSGKPSLLALPTEIQDHILSYVLRERKNVQVKWSHYRYPALFHTCSQIREKALPIYFKQNEFRLVVNEWNFSPFKSFYQLHQKQTQREPLWISMEGKPNWDNLFKWAMGARNSECSALDFEEPNGCIFKEARPMLSTFVSMPEELSNKDLETLAQGFRAVMIKVDPRWAD